MLLVTLPTVGHTQGSLSESARAAAFDRLDRTSRQLIATVGCARQAAMARAAGLLGPPDSVGRTGLCVRIDQRRLGVFLTPDSALTKALDVRVVDLAKGTRYTGALDTAAVLAQARAAREAVRKGYPLFEREKRQFAPLSIRSDGDSIEVWLLPLGLFIGRTISTLGGERGFVYSPDGRTLVREIDASDRFRSPSIPDSGRVEIRSQEQDLPLLSELIATNLLYNDGREVQLITDTFASQLVGPRAAPLWLQLRRR